MSTVDAEPVGCGGRVHAFHRRPSGVPSGRRPSASTVKDSATGSPTDRAARATLMPSWGVVMVIACIRSTPSAAKGRGLHDVVLGCLIGICHGPGHVPVPSGSMDADDQGAVYGSALLRTTDKCHSLMVGPVERDAVVTDLVRPVRIRPPGGGLEQETLSGGTSDRGVLVVVGVQGGAARPGARAAARQRLNPMTTPWGLGNLPITPAISGIERRSQRREALDRIAPGPCGGQRGLHVARRSACGVRVHG